MRSTLVHNYYISTQVGVSNIKLGYKTTIDSIPCITIQRIGGDSYAKLGYGTSTGGSKDRDETRLMQIDIFHDSILNLELLDDIVIKAIFSGSRVGEGLRLTSNPPVWDSSYESYRSIQTWNCNEIVQD